METFKVGQRVQTHPATDVWMQGDRYGTVEHVWNRSDGTDPWAIRVRLDKSGRSIRFSPDDIEVVE